MRYILSLSELSTPQTKIIGGKAASLLNLKYQGFRIPESFVISTKAYEHFVKENQLQGLLQLELFRKDLNNCRWEELWDISLRIKNAFLKAKISKKLRTEIEDLFQDLLRKQKLVARSSSTVEDTVNRSFAGLHDSYIDIRTLNQLTQKIKLVWASLWSDSALSYRKELKLDLKKSSMAILIQTLIEGKCSGIAFSQSPQNSEQTVIEAVYGINQGLVDGKIVPDQWVLHKSRFKLIKFSQSTREEKMVSQFQQPKIVKTRSLEKSKPPLDESMLKEVYELCHNCESYYQIPQDVEWTYEGKKLYLLQSRPVTVKGKIDPKKNRREWDLTLKRSFENLILLREKIENYLTNMSEQAQILQSTNLKNLSDIELSNENSRVQKKLNYWTNIYWETFIPYGHGMRLFGQIYNEVMCPQDPYEFVTLLQKDLNLATRRNNELNRLASLIKSNEKELEHVKKGKLKKLSRTIQNLLAEIVSSFALPTILLELEIENDYTRDFFEFLISHNKNTQNRDSANLARLEKLEFFFLEKFPEGDQRDWAVQLLDLGRHSFLMRDDDNVFLNRFKDAKDRIIREVKTRLELRKIKHLSEYSEEQLIKKFENPDFALQNGSRIQKQNSDEQSNLMTRKRQLTGQPAGPGYISGIARIIREPGEIFSLKQNEIIICDAIGPEMTFAVPVAAGIVEKRGGMLIHGAIIAREYGIPCVTGVTDAMNEIKSGDKVSIDGYLGIVTILKRLQP